MVHQDSGVEKVDVETISAKPPVATKRHSMFYFDNTLVVIQIEDTLFNVHKYQLMKSETFSDMFKTAREDPDEGSTPENPIVLEGVSAADFECLLTVLYATSPISFSHFSARQPTPDASLIIPALRLANKWNFEDLCNYLRPLAEKELGDVDKIVFAREFGVADWLVPAHKNLCRQKEPLTTEEAKKIGIDSVLLIFRLRERFSRPGLTAQCICVGCAGYDFIGGTTCNNCSNYSDYILTSTSFDSQGGSIDSEVEKWVADGCTLK